MEKSVRLTRNQLRALVLLALLAGVCPVVTDSFARARPDASEITGTRISDAEREISQPHIRIAGASDPQAGTMMRTPSGFEMVWIPAGEFTIGSDKADRIRLLHLSEKRVPISSDDVNDEANGPRIIFKSGFWMARYEITQAQWKLSMGNNPSMWKGARNRLGNDDAMPVEQVSYEDAREFLRKLNERNDGWTYRLPSESEWEYACRAGTTGDYAGALDEMAWYANNSGGKYVDAYEIYASKTERYY